jgi:hypothetical protein
MVQETNRNRKSPDLDHERHYTHVDITAASDLETRVILLLETAGFQQQNHYLRTDGGHIFIRAYLSPCETPSRHTWS